MYNYTLAERESLEVGWYFNHNTRPFYMWTPGHLPTVLTDFFSNHVQNLFRVTDDPYTEYRAVRIVNISSQLSGDYSCR